MEKMRAARVVGLGEMVCEQADVRPPEEGELVVRTELAAICGSDLHLVFMGVNLITGGALPGYPGHEGIGTVVESRHPDFGKGERVLTAPGLGHFHCFADFQTIPAAYCVKVPADLPAGELLMAQQLGTVIFALRQRPRDVVGKNVMVVGQGSAGMFFAYLLKRAGAAKVITTDLSEARLDMGRRISGADVALQAGREAVGDAVLDHTGGEGVDYLVEAVGRSETQLEAVGYMRPRGDILYFGLPDTSQPIQFNYEQFFRKALSASSTYGAQEEYNLASFQLAVDLIVRREIDLSKMVSHTFPIEKINDAMHEANARPPTTLKVALSF